MNHEGIIRVLRNKYRLKAYIDGNRCMVKRPESKYFLVLTDRHGDQYGQFNTGYAWELALPATDECCFYLDLGLASTSFHAIFLSLDGI